MKDYQIRTEQNLISRAESHFTNNLYGYLLLGMGAVALWGGYQVLFKSQPEVIKSVVETRNVLGNEAPETFIEAQRVRFYSKIDGQSLDDLVCR